MRRPVIYRNRPRSSARIVKKEPGKSSLPEGTIAYLNNLRKTSKRLHNVFLVTHLMVSITALSYSSRQIWDGDQLDLPLISLTVESAFFVYLTPLILIISSTYFFLHLDSHGYKDSRLIEMDPEGTKKGNVEPWILIDRLLAYKPYDLEGLSKWMKVKKWGFRKARIAIGEMSLWSLLPISILTLLYKWVQTQDIWIISYLFLALLISLGAARYFKVKYKMRLENANAKKGSLFSRALFAAGVLLFLGGVIPQSTQWLPRGSVYSMDLDNEDLTLNQNKTKVTMRQTGKNFYHGSFIGSKVKGIVFVDCDLSLASFYNGNLDSASFRTGSQLEGTCFGKASLIKAEFNGPSVVDCDFSHADLRNSHWSGVGGVSSCDFSHADLRGSDITAHLLQSCDFYQAKVDDRLKGELKKFGILDKLSTQP